jgi:hypothetical protein
MTAPSTRAERLTKAGFVWIEGWVREADAPAFQRAIAKCLPRVEELAAQPRKRGAPRKVKK